MVEKILLSLILFVVSIVRRPSSRDGRELDRDTRSVKHLKRVSDLGKKEPGLAIVRSDDGCVGDNEQNMLGHDGAPSPDVKRLA